MRRAESVSAQTAAGIRRNVGLTERSIHSFQRTAGANIRVGSLLAASRAFERTGDRANLLRAALLSLSGVFGGVTAALSTNIVLRYADSYTQLSNQIRVVSADANDMMARLSAVREVADASRSGLRETAILYSRIQNAAPGRPPAEILRYVETIQKALQSGGATAQEAASAAVQFSQAIASNRLGGEELRAILETPLGLALAKGLNVTIGKFREMGYAGELTAQTVLGALAKVASSVDATFAKSVPTIDNALTILDTGLTQAIGKFNETYGATRFLGGALISLAKNAETAVSLISIAAVGLGALFAGRLLGGRLFGTGKMPGEGQTDMRRGILGYISRIKEESRAAQANVVRLRDDMAKLTADQTAANASVRTAQQAIASPITAAPRSAVAEVERERAAVQRLDERRLNMTEKIAAETRNLGTITSQMTAKAVTLTDQIAASERRVLDLTQQRLGLNRELARVVEAQRVTSAAGTVIGAGPTVSGLNQRVGDIQKSLSETNKAIQKEWENNAKRRIQLATQENNAIQAAASQRQDALRRINELQRASLEIDRARTEAVTNLGKARAAADQAGVAAANTQLQQAIRTTASLNDVMKQNQAEFITASRQASAFGGAIRATGTIVGSFVSFLGGPWGVAFAGAIAAIAIFGAQARKTAEESRKFRDRIREIIAEINNVRETPQTRDSIISGQIRNAEAELETFRVQTLRIRERINQILAGTGGQAGFWSGGGNIAKQLTDSFGRISPMLGELRGLVTGFLDDPTASALDFGRAMDGLNARQAAAGYGAAELIAMLKTEAITFKDAGISAVELTARLGDLREEASAVPDAQPDLDYAMLAANLRARAEAGKQATEVMVSGINRAIEIQALYNQGLKAEARLQERLDELRGDDERDIAPAAVAKLEEAIAVEMAMENATAEIKKQEDAAEALAASYEKIEDIVKEIMESANFADGTFLTSEIDREVVRQARSLEGATEKIKAYVDAIRSGDMSKISDEILQIRDALIAVGAVEIYDKIADDFADAAMATSRMIDFQFKLNALVAGGSVDPRRLGREWANFFGEFRQYKWIDDLADAFGGLALDVETSFATMEEAVRYFVAELLKIAIPRGLHELVRLVGRGLVGATSGALDWVQRGQSASKEAVDDMNRQREIMALRATGNNSEADALEIIQSLKEKGLFIDEQAIRNAATLLDLEKQRSAILGAGGEYPDAYRAQQSVVDAIIQMESGGHTTGAGSGRTGPVEVQFVGGDLRNMNEAALRQFEAVKVAAAALGLAKVVVTAGREGGHLSHIPDEGGGGTEMDIYGVNPDGSRWTREQRVAVAEAARRAGANRFGLYENADRSFDSMLHFGNAGPGRPRAMWGAGGLMGGDASRQYRNQAERDFYAAFEARRPYSTAMDRMPPRQQAIVNDRSTARGIAQFTKPTWLELFRTTFPARFREIHDRAIEITGNNSEAAKQATEAILALRDDSEMSATMTAAYAAANTKALIAAGVSVNDTAVVLAHFLGPNGAIKVLTAAAGTPIAGLLSQNQINANPEVLGGGATVDTVRAFAQAKAGALRRLGGEMTPEEELALTLDEIFAARQRQTEGLILETEAQSQNTYERERAAAVLEIENELLAAGVVNLEDHRAMIDSAAEAYARQTVAMELAKQATENLAKASAAAGEVMGSALKGFISDLIAGKSASEALQGVLQKLGDKLIDVGIDMLMGGLFGKGGAGGGGGLLGGFGGLLGRIFSPTFGGGGLVGASGPGRMISAAAFAGAPRFASGLGSGEFAAILHQGEVVLNRHQQAAVGGLVRGLARSNGSGGSTPVSLTVQVNGARGNREIQEMVEVGVLQGLRHVPGISQKSLSEVSRRSG